MGHGWTERWMDGDLPEPNGPPRQRAMDTKVDSLSEESAVPIVF